jgi:DNA-binding NtrC family response regulator
MASVWIVHRDARHRAALARLAGMGDEAVVAPPGETALVGAAPPRVVVLGLAGDFELELEFAHRIARRLPGTRWLLVAEEADRSDAERLFDSLASEFLPYPPPAQLLGSRVRVALRTRPAERLSERRQRDALSERFSRWFADLELPDLLRALDPRLAGVALLVRGERGSGRGLLAQYVHTFGGSAGGAFVFVPCAELRSAADLLETLRVESEAAADQLGLALCLDNADLLPAAVQQELRRWIEFGPPPGLTGATRLRWMATIGDDLDGALSVGLTAELAQALAGISVRIPPLRERSAAVERFALETVRAWCAAHREEPPDLGADALEVLSEHPWPGNQRELEAVLVRSLAAGPGSPLRAEALRFDHPTVGPSPVPDAVATASLPAQPASAPEWIAEAPAAPPTRETRAPPAPAPPASEPSEADDGTLRRLSQALAHELRNPLVALRTFTELLPERFDDPEFRERFRTTVGGDLERIEGLARRIGAFAELEPGSAERVDVTALLERLLEERRGEIRSRRLLVLKELESEHPHALGRPGNLAFVFESILDRCLRWVPDRGDLYLASRHHPASREGEPSLRVLARVVRRAGPAAATVDAEAARDVSEAETALDLQLAELRLRADGGTLSVSGEDAPETVILVDLKAG